ncbi:hypothetical protein Tco_0345662 [Tanacetum coccineum]
MISSISNQTKSVTACNHNLNSRTSNVNAVCATCGTCVFNANHDACVSMFLKDVNARTKKPNGVPISTRKPKSQANKSVATPHKKTIVQLSLFIVDSRCTKHMTGNLTLLCNFVEKYLGTVRFGNDQFALILGYGDLVQGNITINRVYYVEGLNHNLFSVGHICDADLMVAFWKSTCFVRDLQGNDLLIGNHGSDLYTISLQETTSSTLICLMAKATPTQACKAKRSSFNTKTIPSTKGRLNLLHMDLCGPMRVASINGKKYILSKGYRVYNKRTKLIVESIHLRFDEIKEMSETFVANDTLGLVPQRQKEELHQFDRLQVWELIEKPFRKNVIKLKWLWKNKKDEDQTVIIQSNNCSKGLCSGSGTSDPPIPTRYQARPTEKHLKEVKRIFRYLRGTINIGLWYPKDSGFELTSFSNADHAGCIDTHKSTSGGIKFLGDKLVSWMSKKQDCTAMSSTEAEYVALSASCV